MNYINILKMISDNIEKQYIKIKRIEYIKLIKENKFFRKKIKFLKIKNKKYEDIINTIYKKHDKCVIQSCDDTGNWYIDNDLYCLKHYRQINEEENNKTDTFNNEDEVYELEDDDFLSQINDAKEDNDTNISESENSNKDDIEEPVLDNLKNNIEIDIDMQESDDEEIRSKRNKYTKTDANSEVLKSIEKIKNQYVNLSTNSYIYKSLVLDNRNTIMTFSNIYQKYINNEIDNNYIGELFTIYDKNKSRFLKNLEISYKIHRSEKLVNSSYVFPLYTFNKIKKTSVDDLIHNLENIL